MSGLPRTRSGYRSFFAAYARFCSVPLNTFLIAMR